MLSGLRYNTKENYKPWSKHAKLTNWVSVKQGQIFVVEKQIQAIEKHNVIGLF